MALNTSHADHGVLIYQGENIIIFSDNVTIEFHGNEMNEFKGPKFGRLYLTTHRMIFNSKGNADRMRSFSFPFIAMSDVTVEQPLFSANSIQGKVGAQPNGNFSGHLKFKITFKSGGAIEFGQAMLKAAHLASRHTAPGTAPPPYTPPTGPWAAAPPPAYAPSATGYYGWVPPYETFPNQPPPNSVFVANLPPPYPGVTGVVYPPGAGFSGDLPTSPTGNAPPGYPGYPPRYSGFPPSTPSAPGAPTMSSNDAKAAEAAQSAYYDPNRPQTAYVPPPYDQPPTYQESQSKKQN